MEKSNPTDKDERIRALAPPQNTTSTILSGAGNGMMLGVIPFAGIELYSRIMLKKEPPQKALIASAFATVIGAAIGAVYGAKEAKQINAYRKAVRDEIADLQQQVNEVTAKNERWTEKEQARPTLTNAPSV